MSVTFYGSAYMADYIGSTQSSVSNWAKEGESGFPEPAVLILSSHGSISARGWSELQLADARDWMEKRLGLSRTEALEHWVSVIKKREEHIRRGNVSKGQEKLW